MPLRKTQAFALEVRCVLKYSVNAVRDGSGTFILKAAFNHIPGIYGYLFGSSLFSMVKVQDNVAKKTINVDSMVKSLILVCYDVPKDAIFHFRSTQGGVVLRESPILSTTLLEFLEINRWKSDSRREEASPYRSRDDGGKMGLAP